MTRIWAGRPYPLGASFDGRGVNFALFSAHATRVELCLFEPSGRRQIGSVDLPELTDEVWHGYLSDLNPGQLYGYRVHGPYEPHAGHRFNPHKLLLDPYARALFGQLRWSNAHFGYRVGSGREDLSLDRTDNASGMLKSVVVDPSFGWNQSAGPATRWDETIIYEAHVKGLTQLQSQVPVQSRGRFSGVSDPAIIDHLVALGITAVELLPVQAFLDDRHLTQRGLRNYWGYNSIGFFAPEPRYLRDSRRVYEFQSMVSRLHAAGIEVILDVVYNHTAEGNHLGPTLSFRGIDNASYYVLSDQDNRYYDDFTGCGNSLNLAHPRVLQMVMDSLRYWVQTMHVDGFRFDLATTLGRERSGWDGGSGFLDAIRQDPILQSVKMIAEPWDIGPDGYRLGQHGPGWSEWNDQFRDTVRAFWRGDENTTAELSTRLLGSADLFAHRGRRPWSSINFISAHDGFCLDDLVSYNEKHNEANGEDNRDGHDHNLSYNFGIEGPTDDARILEARARQKRNLLGTLLLSQGTPMLLAGDEIGHRQGGNNNVYCQDNELAWIDWRGIDAGDRTLLDFTRELIRLRREHPVLRRASFLHGDDVSEQGTPDIVWLRAEGGAMDEAAWHDPARKAFGMMLTGQAGVHLPPEGPPEDDETFLLLFNAADAPCQFEMPGQEVSDGWQRVLDSADPKLRSGAQLWREFNRFELQARSFSVFKAGRRSRAAGVRHTMPFGAEVLDGSIVRFRLWAPAVEAPKVRLSDSTRTRDIPMLASEGAGWFELITDAAGPGSQYQFIVGGETAVPDPASKAQAGGPHEPSIVVDPSTYRWQTVGWQGRRWEETVLLELHVGTFSAAGTFDGVRLQLERLAGLGITAIELMPLATFTGERNWGYDGVLPFAPDRTYGEPDALKALIDEAHRLGIQVFLDVVYNHFGPDGNYLHLSAPAFYRDDEQTPWGRALDFRHETVRSFFVHNALYWLTEYQFDGLRLDAVHAISDDARRQFLDELSKAVANRFRRSRHIHLMIENEENDVGLLEHGYTAQWNDDIHHCLHTVLTGQADGYYADYIDAPMDKLVRALSEGFVFQGEPMKARGGRERGQPSAHLAPQRFIAFMQNHDQIGNRPAGDRLSTQVDPVALRAAHALLLLCPQIPMLFMGEEWGSKQPFQFFTDFGGDLGQAVRDGRRREFSGFTGFTASDLAEQIPDPESAETLLQSRLDTDGPPDANAWKYQQFVAELIQVRHQFLVPMLRSDRPAQVDSRRVAERGLEIRWTFESGAQWALLAQLDDGHAEGFERPAGDLVWCSVASDAGRIGRGIMGGWSVAAF